MSEIKIRAVQAADIDKLLKIEKDAWRSGEKSATKQMLNARLEVFPEGMFCAVVEGKIVGFCVQEIIKFDDFEETDMSWNTLTDNGCIRKSHNLLGDILYGVSISVPPYISNRNVALKLYEYCGKLAIRYNLKKIYTGSRVPKYYKYADNMPIEEYVHAKTKTGRCLDPEIALYLKMGMKIEKIIPNYFSDPESKDYGVLVSWRNPFYFITKRSKVLSKLLGNLFRL